MKFFNITKILLFASISMTISTFTMNNGISIIANAQSDECSMNACTLINNGRCTSREKCATLGEKYTWNDSLCTKNDDKCGCCFPKDATKSPTRKPFPITGRTRKPTLAPTKPTMRPTRTRKPTKAPTNPTMRPTRNPVVITTRRPTTSKPTRNPIAPQCLTFDPVCSQKGGFCRISPNLCPTNMKSDPSLCGSSEKCFCCLPITG